MKTIKIQIVINDKKIATAMQVNGFKDDDVSNNLELIGTLDNAINVLKASINNKLKVLFQNGN